MSVKARCLNYTGCLLAYRGEVIELAQNAPLVCPECGKTVNVVRGGGKGAGQAVAWIVVVLVLGTGLYFALPYISKYISKKPAPTEETDPGGSSTGTPRLIGEATPVVVPDSPNATPAEPPKPPVAVAKPDLSLQTEKDRQVRDEVIKRIDVMKIKDATKDRLYASVTRARRMGLIVTIPFASGVSRLPGAEIGGVREALESPAIMKLREDPTAVFVVLGFADSTGDEKKNLAISQSRADSVLEAMKEKCGMGSNVLHAVAMGGSKIIDEKNFEKNRVVEIWAVLP